MKGTRPPTPTTKPACVPTYPQPWAHYLLSQVARAYGMTLRQVATLAIDFVATEHMTQGHDFTDYVAARSTNPGQSPLLFGPLPDKP